MGEAHRIRMLPEQNTHFDNTVLSIANVFELYGRLAQGTEYMTTYSTDVLQQHGQNLFLNVLYKDT